MHAYSNIEFWDLNPRFTNYYSSFHSNRIKILLILQLETYYFSSYLFQKWSMQSSGITVYTETSSSFIPLILHEEIQGILPVLILHAEGKEIFYPVYKDLQGIPGIPAARPSTGIPVPQGHSSHSRHSSHFRHSSHSRHSSLPGITTRSSTSSTFQCFQYIQGFHPLQLYSILQLEFKFYTPIGFH